MARVSVKLYGLLSLELGPEPVELEAERLGDVFPELAGLLGRPEKELRACLVFLNKSRVSPGTRLKDGDQIALLPPSAGG